MTSKEVVDRINAKRGKSKGWPDNFNYSLSDDKSHATVTFVRTFDKKGFRRLDSWSLAFVKVVEEQLDHGIERLTLDIPSCEDKCKYDLESLRRRASFLNFNNSRISIDLHCEGKPVELYNQVDLLRGPNDGEVVREDYSDKSDNDKADLLEKAFQAYLFGKNMEIRTNDRLAIFGEDFQRLKGKNYGVVREFATGVFGGRKKEKDRILPTEYVDLVSLNKHGVLSVIELKLDDSQLEVISQLLDYALFFRKYITEIVPLLKQRLLPGEDRAMDTSNISCYLVSNAYHPHFNKIREFYDTDGKPYGFEIKKVVLGHTEKI